MTREEVKIEGYEPIPVYRHGNDINGNPRYFVHYLALGLKSYSSTAKTRKAGLRIFHGRAFGGGYTFTSDNVDRTIQHIIKILES